MTTMAEPEWDEETRNLVLANDQVDLCPRCGRPTFICQDPANQFNWKAQPPVRCHATTALRLAQKGVTEETNPAVDALIWRVALSAEAR